MVISQICGLLVNVWVKRLSGKKGQELQWNKTWVLSGFLFFLSQCLDNWDALFSEVFPSLLGSPNPQSPLPPGNSCGLSLLIGLPGGDELSSALVSLQASGKAESLPRCSETIWKGGNRQKHVFASILCGFSIPPPKGYKIKIIYLKQVCFLHYRDPK